MGFLLAPAEGFGLRPRLLFALWAKKSPFCSFLVFSSNLNNFYSNHINFEKNYEKKKHKKKQKNTKIKKSENIKKKVKLRSKINLKNIPIKIP